MSDKVYAVDLVTCLFCAGDGHVIASTKALVAAETGIPAQTKEIECPSCAGTGVVRVTVVRDPEPVRFADRAPYTSRTGHVYIPR